MVWAGGNGRVLLLQNLTRMMFVLLKLDVSVLSGKYQTKTRTVEIIHTEDC